MDHPAPPPPDLDGAAPLVIVGAGAAGVELAFVARQSGWPGPITLLGDEAALPYHRPPLSKDYLGPDPADIALRPDASYAAGRIELRRGMRVRRIDPAGQTLHLADGTSLPYARLALCTGGRPRPLPVPGAAAANMHYLRTHDDAAAIRTRLLSGVRFVVIGGGYVGLEVAASARQAGALVTVLEAQDRVLARVACPELSAFAERMHRAQGVVIHTGASVTSVTLDTAGLATGVVLADGRSLAADALVVGVGMLPNAELAAEAGLEVDGGIVVDELSATSDPAIYAAGDCTVFDSALYGRRVRLESVPNALAQARAAASALCGAPKPNRAVPWFWSDQYGTKLQMVGLHEGYEQLVLRGDMAGGAFAMFYLRNGRTLAATAVNRPADFMLAKRLVAEQRSVDPLALANESAPLKALLARAA